MYSIGELAARFGLATHVLRHWETAGVLQPAGRQSGRRRYGPAHVARLAMIVRCRQVGFSLPEIQAMLDAPDPTARRAVLEEKQAALVRLQAEIAATNQLIEHALDCPEHDFSQCPGFQAVVGHVIAGSDLAAARAMLRPLAAQACHPSVAGGQADSQGDTADQA